MWEPMITSAGHIGYGCNEAAISGTKRKASEVAQPTRLKQTKGGARVAVPVTTNMAAACVCSVICFSKDRALQLSEALRTLILHARMSDGSGAFAAGAMEITVLHRAAEGARSQALYARVREAFSAVHFVVEQEGRFAEQLCTIVEQSKSQLIMFMVDDALFIRDFCIQSVVKVMRDHLVFAYHLKLHPGISMSHPSGYSVVKIPDLRLVSGNSIIFQRSEGSQDFNYPFDLCGSIYYRSDVERVLRAIHAKTKGGASHPNLLESNGIRV
eukprot:g5415.t1